MCSFAVFIVLQCVAVSCSVLQFVAACCSVLQSVATISRHTLRVLCLPHTHHAESLSYPPCSFSHMHPTLCLPHTCDVSLTHTSSCIYKRDSEPVCHMRYGVATISRMLKNIGLFCKRDLQKRPIFCKET